MANDGEHQMRRQLDVRLAQLVEDLQTSPELQARGDRLAAELLEQPPCPRPHPLPATPASDSRSEEHTSELQSLMRISYAVFCLKKKNNTSHNNLISIRQ